MCPVQVEGPLGPETVTMVDVEQLRSRCLPLGRIEDLMDLRRREKKPKRPANRTGPGQWRCREWVR